jgi:peptide/nickel transport system substrate-binding protein
MHNHRAIAAFTTVAMSAGLSFALTFLAATPSLAAGGVLRARMNADIRSTDPGTNRDANTDGVIGHVVEGLVAFREDTSIGPMLADGR